MPGRRSRNIGRWIAFVENRKIVTKDRWTGTFEVIKRLPDQMKYRKRCTFNVAVVGKRLYLMTWMAELFSISLSGNNRTWKEHPRSKFLHGPCPQMTVINGLIYVIGGGWPSAKRCRKYECECPRFSARSEAYDPRINNWIELPRLPNTLRRNHSQIKLNGLLLCIGGLGIRDNVRLQSCEDEPGYALRDVAIYHPETKYWAQGAPLRHPRVGPGLAIDMNGIYAIGGLTDQPVWHYDKSIERYDAAGDTWTVMDFKLKEGRMLCRAYVFDNEIFVVGGKTTKWRRGTASERIEMRSVA